jgi:serine/threonine protein kinase
MSTVRNLNDLLRRFAPLLTALEVPGTTSAGLRVDWQQSKLVAAPEPVAEFLISSGLLKPTKGSSVLTPAGLTLASKLLIDYSQLEKATIADRYAIHQRIAEGTESVAFEGFHTALGSHLCFKVFRPGQSSPPDGYHTPLGAIKSSETLVLPTDMVPIHLQDVYGQFCEVPCLIYPFITHPTLREFIKNERPLSPFFINEFIIKVASGLRELELHRLTHGDLHENNILCGKNSDNSIDIKIIDITGGRHTVSPFASPRPDFEAFKEHLQTILYMLPLPRLSVQKHLGAPTFELLKYILAQKTLTFAEVLQLLESQKPYELYVRSRDAFLAEKFPQAGESSLSLLRYEEIINPREARALFLPYRPLFDDLSEFGNAILYGHRGSGKSSYLGSMAYFPGTEGALLNPEASFGIFFACRQGEFKHFSNALVEFTRPTQLRVKHLLILKIIRKTIGILRDAGRQAELVHSDQTHRLSRFLEAYVNPGATLTIKEAGVTELHNLHASLLRNEVEEIDRLFAQPKRDQSLRLLTERNLVEFFELLRSCFSDLASARFFVLFDDAGAPNVPQETQAVLNELLRCTNPVFCVKISAERFSYTKESADGKPLEQSHDYRTYDISDRLRLGTPADDKRRRIGEHFRELVERRLARYKSQKIEDYLGKNPISAADFARQLIDNPNRAPLYAGWDIVWQLADRTPRHLLELVSQIFADAGVTQRSAPRPISLDQQSASVIAYSTTKLRALGFIPGALPGQSHRRSLGARLQSFATSFGKIARTYLKRGQMRSKGKRIRFYELLAIELDDQLSLTQDTEAVLEGLVRYAVLDDTKLTQTRDDKLRKPIYIFNRVFCPALQISFRREVHLRLSSVRFDRYLADPENFATQYVRRLPVPSEDDLFPQE